MTENRQFIMEFAENVDVAKLQAERDKWKRMFIHLYESLPITEEITEAYKKAVYERFL